ncbi:MAG: YIP1 family protein [Candidatus Marinimicrobia bacterium]|nr:YIP1 family protein [Candidatus Neomarinimicrobiota bacterium]
MSENQEKTILLKILSLFWEPSGAFQSLKTKISWLDILIPLLIVIIISLISTSYIVPIAITEQKVLIETSERLTDIQKETIIERMESKADSPVQYITTAIAVIVKALVLAAVMLFVGNFLLGGEVKYFTMIGVTAYVGLVDVVSLGIKTPLIVSQETTKVYTSLALLLEESEQFLFRFFANIDVFAIWKIVLFSIAIGIILDKKASKPFWIITIIWLIYAVAAAALAGLVKI